MNFQRYNNPYEEYILNNIKKGYDLGSLCTSVSRLHLKHNKQRFCLRSYNMSAQPAAFDWNKIVHKNVKSNDMRYLGNITDVDNDSFILLRDADQRYRIPKSRVKDFNGNDVTVDFRFNDLLLVELASLSYITSAERMTDYDGTTATSSNKKTFVLESN